MSYTVALSHSLFLIPPLYSLPFFAILMNLSNVKRNLRLNFHQPIQKNIAAHNINFNIEYNKQSPHIERRKFEINNEFSYTKVVILTLLYNYI